MANKDRIVKPLALLSSASVDAQILRRAQHRGGRRLLNTASKSFP